MEIIRLFILLHTIILFKDNKETLHLTQFNSHKTISSDPFQIAALLLLTIGLCEKLNQAILARDSSDSM